MATYYVNKNGSASFDGASYAHAKLTIQQGIDLMNPGDTLLIGPGIWDEYFVGTWIVGGNDDASRKTIASYNTQDRAIIKPSSAPAQVFNFSYANQRYITLQDLVVDGSTATQYNIQVIWESGGGSANPSAFIRFQRLEVLNSPTNGITLFDNTMVGNNGNEILDCEIHHNGASATYHGIYCRSKGNLIEGGWVHHNAHYGVHLFHQDSSDVSNNEVRYVRSSNHTVGYGFLMGCGDNNLCKYCLAYSNFGGFRLDAPGSTYKGTGNKLHNCTSYRNQGGGAQYFVAAGMTNSEVINCIGIGSSPLSDTGTATVKTTNITSNFDVDAKMIDPAHGNFKINRNSPAFGTGTYKGYTRDIDNISVSGRFDIGAFAGLPGCIDNFGRAFDILGGGRRMVPVVPDNNNDLPEVTRGLYIGVGGDVAVIFSDDTASVVMKNKAQGYCQADRVKRVLSTGTTATNILAVY